MSFTRAIRKKARLRVGVLGPAGGGKTWGALKLASGLAAWEKIFLIDSERGSASLYAHMGPFNVKELDGDFNPKRYVDAIHEAEEAGAEVIIIDSLSHAWSGTGGTLDIKAAKEAKTNNGWTAWRDVTPLHNALVDAMLQSRAHIIATMRVKMEYVQEKDATTGKTVIRKVGMQPIQRDSLEYEFSLVLDVDSEHWAVSTKDRTSLFDGKRFQIGADTGKTLREWLDMGVDAPAPALPHKQDLTTLHQPPQPLAVDEFEEATRYTRLLNDATTLEELKVAWASTPHKLHAALEDLKNKRKEALSHKEK